ncbi:MAG: DUF5009 domain-containing protein [Proteobacteria bacterium]|nr:DUF5009 domain-containing protein [Pseudomonadota bacterium]
MQNDNAVIAPRPDRVVAVDALRGFNFVWILGGDGLIWALSGIMGDLGWPWDDIGDTLNYQFHHVAWEGFTFYDFIFPLFVFITGVSIVLSVPRQVERTSRGAAQLRILRRAVTLYLLGLVFYGGLTQGLGDVRFLGVLQRIAICYLAASLLFLHVGRRGIVGIIVALLVGYWALMTFVPVPGIGTGHYGPDQNLANWLDLHFLPGRLWDKTRDPEGMLSTLPAIASCLLGVLAGGVLTDDSLTPQRRSLLMLAIGIVVLGAGHLWALQFPIVKSIWTSSFVLVAGGYSFILLGLFYQIIDVWRLRAWATVFVWIGTNAITLYLLNALMSFNAVAQRLVGGYAVNALDRLSVPGTHTLLLRVVELGLAILVARFLYRRRIFLRV